MQIKRALALFAAAILLVMMLGACNWQPRGYVDAPHAADLPLILSVYRYDEPGSYTSLVEQGVGVGYAGELEAQPGVTATVTVLGFDDEAVTVRFETQSMISQSAPSQNDGMFEWTTTIPFGEEYQLDALLRGGLVRFIYTFTKNSHNGTQTTTTAIPQTSAEPLMLRVERYDRAGPPTDEGGTYTPLAEKSMDAGGTLHLEAQSGVHVTIEVLAFDDETVMVRFQAENMLSSRRLHELDPLPLEYSWEAEIPFGEEYSLDALLNGGHVRFIYTFTKNSH